MTKKRTPMSYHFTTPNPPRIPKDKLIPYEHTFVFQPSETGHGDMKSISHGLVIEAKFKVECDPEDRPYLFFQIWNGSTSLSTMERIVFPNPEDDAEADAIYSRSMAWGITVDELEAMEPFVKGSAIRLSVVMNYHRPTDDDSSIVEPKSPISVMLFGQTTARLSAEEKKQVIAAHRGKPIVVVGSAFDGFPKAPPAE